MQIKTITKEEFINGKSPYEEFQEWLNECPVKITRYEDFTDFFEVTFEVPLEEEDDSGVELENVTDEWYDADGNIKH